MPNATNSNLADIKSLIKQTANDVGFELAGVAGVYDFPELEYFPEWIAQGNAGEMAYLQARDEVGKLKRGSLRSTVPWARSVVVCAINYNTSQPYSTESDEPTRGWISRYAWSQQDYHEIVLKKLKLIETRLRAAIAEADSSCGEPFQTPAFQTP